MTGLIILAAGPSTRLGKPKQLLKYKGESLIRHVIRAGMEADCDPSVVVLGASYEDIFPEIVLSAVKVIYNENWEEGMASSIRSGVEGLLETNPYVDDAIIALCDQPMVNGSLLRNLMQQKQNSRKGIVACSYDNTVGVPVLFDRTYFPELIELQGDEGARKLLQKNRKEMVSIPFPGGSIDIDTIGDYEGLE